MVTVMKNCSIALRTIRQDRLTSHLKTYMCVVLFQQRHIVLHHIENDEACPTKLSRDTERKPTNSVHSTPNAASLCYATMRHMITKSPSTGTPDVIAKGDHPRLPRAQRRLLHIQSYLPLPVEYQHVMSA